MNPPRPEVLNEAFTEITGQRIADMTPGEAAVVLQKMPNLDQQVSKLNEQEKYTNITRTDLENHVNTVQKGFFRRALETTGSAIAWPFKTAGTIVNAPFKLLEKVPVVGKPASKILKVALIAAATYYGGKWLLNFLSTGHGVVADAANRMLDRIAALGGRLFPEVNVNPAAPANQRGIPGVDVTDGA